MGATGLEPSEITICKNNALQNQTKAGDAKSDTPSINFKSQSLSRLLTQIMQMLSELSPEVKVKLIDILEDITNDKLIRTRKPTYLLDNHRSADKQLAKKR